MLPFAIHSVVCRKWQRAVWCNKIFPDSRSTINGKLGQSLRVCFLKNFTHKALLVYPNLHSHNSIYFLIYLQFMWSHILGRSLKSELEWTRQEVLLPNMWYCAGFCLKGFTATADWPVSRSKLIPGPYECQVVLLAAPAWTFNSNIHWTEQCSPVNITPLHAWDTVLGQCEDQFSWWRLLQFLMTSSRQIARTLHQYQCYWF
jgi:hypothetical protein